MIGQTMPDDPVHNMALRLTAINWNRREDKSWSKAALLKEYFRRAAQWARAYRIDTPGPFYDIAAGVDPTIRAHPRLVADVLATTEDAGRNVARLIPSILHWTALTAATGFTLPPGLDDPFEPLILLLERGGGFHIENGYAEVEYKSVRIAGWRDRADDPQTADLSPKALDTIDRDRSLAQFGYPVDPT